MQIKKLLTQALLFQTQPPAYSSVKELFSAIKEYENDNSVYILEGKRRERVVLKNSDAFFIFLSEATHVAIHGFDDIHKYLSTSSRKENIEFCGDSKHRYVSVFDNTLLVKKKEELPQLYQREDLGMLEHVERFVAVENSESFLRIDSKTEHFSAEYFVYLGGYGNSLTRSFLANKEVEFFVDYDIEGMHIYEGFSAKKKSFHMPKNLECYFASSNFNSQKLYQKQRHRMRPAYSQELQPLLRLITQYATVVEQEIVYEA